jgi:hypothetical protein
MKSLAESDYELSEDIIFLKKINSETQEHLVDIRKQVKFRLKGAKSKDVQLLKFMMDLTSKQNFEFLDLASYVESLFSSETLDLTRIRNVRNTFLEFIINLDKVTLKILKKPELTAYEQTVLYLGIFEGIDGFEEQVRKLTKLKRLTRNLAGILNPLGSIDGLTRARILMSFYAKWLTIAENEFTDKKLESSEQMQKEFARKLKRILDLLSNAKKEAEKESKYAARIESLRALIETSPEKEKVFQKFFEQNPDFLNRQVSRIIPQKSFGGEQYPDIILALSDGKYIIVELEKPSLKLFTLAGDETKELTHAEKQVSHYISWAIEDKEYLRKRNLENLSAENTTGLVVIGTELNKIDKRNLEILNNTVKNAYTVKTFNDIVRENESCLQNLRKYPLKPIEQL